MSNPIEAAVMPLKAEAQDRAEQVARLLIAKVYAELEAAEWKINVVAPYPQSMRDSRKVYHEKKARQVFVTSLTTMFFPNGDKMNPVITRWDDMEFIVRKDDEAVERIVKRVRADAATQYDAFVAKLVQKVGAHDAATLVGSHVWGHSILTVQRGPVSERWKTQMIINVSKLGKLFNQFPTRKVK
jgi:hypothetical protein